MPVDGHTVGRKPERERLYVLQCLRVLGVCIKASFIPPIRLIALPAFSIRYKRGEDCSRNSQNYTSESRELPQKGVHA